MDYQVNRYFDISQGRFRGGFRGGSKQGGEEGGGGGVYGVACGGGGIHIHYCCV